MKILGAVFFFILTMVTFSFPSVVFADYTLRFNTTITGNDIRAFKVPDSGSGYSDCERACDKEERCQAYTYVWPGVWERDGRCFLKSEISPEVTSKCCTTGVKRSRENTSADAQVIQGEHTRVQSSKVSTSGRDTDIQSATEPQIQHGRELVSAFEPRRILRAPPIIPMGAPLRICADNKNIYYGLGSYAEDLVKQRCSELRCKDETNEQCDNFHCWGLDVEANCLNWTCKIGPGLVDSANLAWAYNGAVTECAINSSKRCEDCTVSPVFACECTEEASAGSVPYGSYLESCEDESVGMNEQNQPTLTASCKPIKGPYRSTKLVGYDRCNDIANQNGILVCARDSIPVGSYKLTCIVASAIDDILQAACKRENGNYNNAILHHYSECKGGIWNNDGYLTCTK